MTTDDLKLARDTPTIAANRIRWHLQALELSRVPLILVRISRSRREARLIRWRTIIRLAQDEYEKELSELESLSVPMSDPAIQSAMGEIVV